MESNIQKAQTEKGLTVYEVAGEEVKLSFDIVKNYLTRGNGSVTQSEVVQFISLCKFNKLNPFLGESYLVKFGSQMASMIVSKEAFMKRAEASANYDGFQAGVIVKRKAENSNVFVEVENEGCFVAEGDTLVGGWAKVYRSDRKYPIVAKVSMKEYDKKQSIWNEKPSTMIRKVALVQALREAFPAQLGAMYIAEESSTQVEDANYEEVVDAGKVAEEVSQNANKEQLNINGEVVMEDAPKTSKKADEKKQSGEPIGKQEVPDMFK